MIKILIKKHIIKILIKSTIYNKETYNKDINKRAQYIIKIYIHITKKTELQKNERRAKERVNDKEIMIGDSKG